MTLTIKDTDFAKGPFIGNFVIIDIPDFRLTAPFPSAIFIEVAKDSYRKVPLQYNRTDYSSSGEVESVWYSNENLRIGICILMDQEGTQWVTGTVW
jgi:hypothetical protein